MPHETILRSRGLSKRFHTAKTRSCRSTEPRPAPNCRRSGSASAAGSARRCTTWRASGRGRTRSGSTRARGSSRAASGAAGPGRSALHGTRVEGQDHPVRGPRIGQRAVKQIGWKQDQPAVDRLHVDITAAEIGIAVIPYDAARGEGAIEPVDPVTRDRRAGSRDRVGVARGKVVDPAP